MKRAEVTLTKEVELTFDVYDIINELKNDELKALTIKLARFWLDAEDIAEVCDTDLLLTYIKSEDLADTLEARGYEVTKKGGAR